MRIVIVFILVSAIVPGCRAPTPATGFDRAHQSLDQLQSRVARTLGDVDRAASAERIIQNLHATTADLEKARADYLSQLRELNADYNSTRSQFVAAHEQHDERIATLTSGMIDLRRQLAAIVSEAEWTALTND